MRNKTNVNYLRIDYFHIDNNVIKCQLTYEIPVKGWPIFGFTIDADLLIKIGNKLHMNTCYIDKETNYPSSLVFTTYATATCDSTDKYDDKLGEHIALTRAQAKAFEKTCKFYDMLQIELDKSFSEMTRIIDNNWHAANKCWDHAKELGGY